VFLLRLKSSLRFTPIRREITGAVIGLNPAAGKKFRRQREENWERAEKITAQTMPDFRPKFLCQSGIHSHI
jgi:hypothetical protein